MRYLWVNGGDSRAIIEAKDESEAGRKIVALRIANFGQTAKQAVGWFHHHDVLYPIDVPVLNSEPYRGTMDEDGFDEDDEEC